MEELGEKGLNNLWKVVKPSAPCVLPEADLCQWAELRLREKYGEAQEAFPNVQEHLAKGCSVCEAALIEIEKDLKEGRLLT